MIASFKTLFTLIIAHAYYNGTCEDVNFILPADTERRLGAGRLRARIMDGQLYVLFEADATGVPRAPLPGSVLRFGLQLANPFFTNYTAVAANFSSTWLRYRNATAPGSLDAPQVVSPVGPVFSHVLSSAARPATVTLTDANGVVLQTDTITAAADRPSVSYDLTGLPAGCCTVQETYPASNASTVYYVDAELLAAGVFGVVELKIDNGFYTAAAALAVPFSARQETLKYYVVAASGTDLTQLTVSDTGYTADGRAQISFTAVAAAAFTPDDLAPALLGGSAATVILFQSQALVARTQQARTLIQLVQNPTATNPEVLIPNLPQPGPDKCNADLIIALTKP